MADLVITPANVAASANAVKTYNGTAGAAINAGDVLYRDNDGSLKLADANAPAPANSVFGIALNSAAIGQPVAYVQEDPSFAPGAVVTPGALYVLSATPGKIAPSTDLASGMTAIVIGPGLAGNQINFRPLVGAALA